MRVYTSKVSPVFSRVCTLLEVNLTVYMRIREKGRVASKKMKVNIVADFKENGMDKNEPHIVGGTNDEMVAGYAVLRKLQAQGCDVQMLAVIDGDWSLKELHDMANYGMYRDKVQPRVIYLSEEARAYLGSIRNDPEEAKRLRKELAERQKRRPA